MAPAAGRAPAGAPVLAVREDVHARGPLQLERLEDALVFDLP